MNGIKGYISIREASYRWGVSERRVNQYCAEGRIPGASRFGRSWAIPKMRKSRPTRAFRNSPAIPTGQAPDGYPLHFSIRKKEVNDMACDEAFYRQYLSGDDEGA